MPEQFFKKMRASILPQWNVCFFSALITGLFAHLYKITNWLPNWDSLVFRYDPQNMISAGRWFLPVVCSFSSFYDLPFLNGLISIVFHALGAVFVCRILHVQKYITAAIIGAVLVSFPTVTSVMMYNYVADGYAISFFLAVLAAWYMTREKPRYLLASVLIALSSGIYQAYITVTIMLILIHLIDSMMFKEMSFRVALKKCIFMLLSGIFGVVLYWIILQGCLSVFSIELLDYQGIKSSVSLSGINLADSLYVIKETFISCFFDLSGGLNVYVALNGIVFVLTAFYYLKIVVTRKIYKKIPDLMMILLLGVLLIFGACALAFINAGVDYHNLMRMGYAVFYLFFVLIYERGSEKTEVGSSVRCWTVLIIAAVLVFNQTVISNVSYHKAQMAYEKSYGMLIRIADRIEQIPESRDCDRVLVIGSLEDSKAYSVNLTPDMTGITDGYIIRADDESVGQSVLCSALNDYCGTDYQFISGEEKDDLLQRDDIQSMGVWPAADCVAVIDDIVIIKLSLEVDS